MIGPEKTSRLDFHTGIVRANKRQVNVPFAEDHGLCKARPMSP